VWVRPKSFRIANEWSLDTRQDVAALTVSVHTSWPLHSMPRVRFPSSSSSVAPVAHDREQTVASFPVSRYARAQQKSALQAFACLYLSRVGSDVGIRTSPNGETNILPRMGETNISGILLRYEKVQ
jgi:hypothetical protein